MRKFIRTSTALGVAGVALLASLGARADVFIQTYEMPGVVNTTTTFSSGPTVETFDAPPAATGGFVSPLGTYSDGLLINDADQFGGAGNTGRYAASFSADGYSISLKDDATFFGYWLSALDVGNVVEFYYKGDLVGSLGATAVSTSIGSNTAYFGNPVTGQNKGEPYAFVNFYDTTGKFDQVVFREVDNGTAGYESDNHTVGIYKDIGGVPVVPEPSTYALMVAGLGALGFAARRRRQS